MKSSIHQSRLWIWLLLVVGVCVVCSARGGPRIPQKTSESPARSQVPSLYESLQDYFPVGAAIEREDITGPHSELLVKHFNSIVAENAMKMGPLQPKEGQFDFATADALVRFATAHHMLVRGHTLVWHRQNPDWLFKDANGNELQPGPESKALVLARMQAHIRTVVSHYKDDVYAWDVVNEVIDPTQADGFRRTKWYELTGTEYIDTAFRTAREVAPHAKLYINEYNTTDPVKRRFLLNLISALKARGVPIDGVGHQMHINIDSPSIAPIVETINMFADLGVDNQITELDVSVYDNPRESCSSIPEDVLIEQGYRYRDLFETFRSLKAEISAVTLWGVADDHTWLTKLPNKRLDLPLLFDGNLQPKPAYWGIVDLRRLPKRRADAKLRDSDGCSAWH